MAFLERTHFASRPLAVVAVKVGLAVDVEAMLGVRRRDLTTAPRHHGRRPQLKGYMLAKE